MSKPEVDRAKRICASCPVRRTCLENGMSEEWGIWGGYTKPERARALKALGGKEDVMDAFDDSTLDEAVALP